MPIDLGSSSQMPSSGFDPTLSGQTAGTISTTTPPTGFTAPAEPIKDTQEASTGDVPAPKDYTSSSSLPKLVQPGSSEGKIIVGGGTIETLAGGQNLSSSGDASQKSGDSDVKSDGSTQNGDAEASLFVDPEATSGKGKNSGGEGGDNSNGQPQSNAGSSSGSTSVAEGDSAPPTTDASSKSSSSTGAASEGDASITSDTGAEGAQGASSSSSTGTIDEASVTPTDASILPEEATFDVGSLTAEQEAALTAIKSGQDLSKADAKTINFLQSGVKTLEETVATANSLLADLPPSPEKANFLSFLKEVSASLVEFSTLLYQLQGEDLAQAKKSAMVQKDAAVDQIEKRRKQEHDRIKKERKAHKKAKLGILGKIFSFVKIIFLAIAAAVIQMIPGLGQVAGAFIVAQMVDEFCKTCGIKFNMTQLLMKGMTEMVVAIAKSINPNLSEDAIKNIENGTKAFIASVNIAAMVASPVAFALGGGGIIQSTLIESGIINDPKLKQILGITLMVTQTVATIIMTVVMMLIPGAQGAAIGQLSGAAANLVDKLNKIKDIVEIVASVMQAVVTVTEGVNNALIADLRKKLALSQGQYESDLVLIQALIKMMKDLMAKLQAGISDFAKQISNIQGSLQKNFSDLAQGMDALYNA